MSNELVNTPEKTPGKVGKLLNMKPQMIAFIIIAAFLCIVLIIIGWRFQNYGKVKAENEELQARVSELEKTQKDYDKIREQLAYSEGQIRLYKESTNALIEQVSKLNAATEKMNNKLEDFFHIEPTVPIVTKDILEEQISALSELVTNKYMYTNAKRSSDSKKWIAGWGIPFSERSVLAVYDGTIMASLDLKEVKLDINERTKTITVTLPDSKILSHNIPQETINILESKNGLFNPIKPNDYNRFIAAEEPEMEQRAIDQGLLTEANEESKKIIEAFLKTVPGMDAYTLKFN